MAAARFAISMGVALGVANPLVRYAHLRSSGPIKHFFSSVQFLC